MVGARNRHVFDSPSVSRGPRYAVQQEADCDARDLLRLAQLLRELPESLAKLPSVSSIVLDALAQEDYAPLIALGALPAAEESESVRIISLSRALSPCVDAETNSAVRFERGLLESTRGRDRLLAVALLVQLGMHSLTSEAGLERAWIRLWTDVRPSEALSAAARTHAATAYGIALGVHAVAPDWLHKRAPRTHAFLSARFGGAFVHWRGSHEDANAIEVALAIADLAALIRGTTSLRP